VIHLTAAVVSTDGVRLFSVMMFTISAFERMPEVAVQGPGSPPSKNTHPGVLQDGSARVNERPYLDS
jgi:hypothetical protein